MKAKVLSVYDEGSLPGTPLIGAKGFAVLVDADGQRTLFDTGLRSNYLIHNMDHLEIDADTVDRVVISHMHRGHTGGLPGFLGKRKERIDVIVTPDHSDVRHVRVFGIPVKTSGLPKMEEKEKEMMNIVVMNEWTQLSENLFLTGTVNGVQENSLVLMTKSGPVLICGCCHPGVGAMLSFVEERTGKRAVSLAGGIHLTDKKKNDVHAVAETLKEHGLRSMYLNHCSGQTQRTHLREKLGMDAVKDFYVGTELQFDVR